MSLGVPRFAGSIIVFVCGMYYRWQQIAYFGWIVPAFTLITTLNCPESQVFLVKEVRVLGVEPEPNLVVVLQKLGSVCLVWV